MRFEIEFEYDGSIKNPHIEHVYEDDERKHTKIISANQYQLISQPLIDLTDYIDEAIFQFYENGPTDKMLSVFVFYLSNAKFNIDYLLNNSLVNKTNYVAVHEPEWEYLITDNIEQSMAAFERRKHIIPGSHISDNPDLYNKHDFLVTARLHMLEYYYT